VEKHTRQHPELLAELHSIQDALLKYNDAYSHRPPPGLEEKILNSIPDPAQATVPPPPVPPSGKPKRAASLAGMGLLIALAFLLYFFLQNRKNKEALAQTTAQLEQLRSDCDKVKLNNATMAQYIAAVGSAGNKPIVMKGLEIAPNALGIVHWNQDKILAPAPGRETIPALGHREGKTDRHGRSYTGAWRKYT
jgi:hypothetical protein